MKLIAVDNITVLDVLYFSVLVGTKPVLVFQIGVKGYLSLIALLLVILGKFYSFKEFGY